MRNPMYVFFSLEFVHIGMPQAIRDKYPGQPGILLADAQIDFPDAALSRPIPDRLCCPCHTFFLLRDFDPLRLDAPSAFVFVNFTVSLVAFSCSSSLFVIS